MKKIAVIGGGASGLVAAIYASSGSNEVTILERNEVCGKKILATGNGKCNYGNSNQDPCHYHSENKEKLSTIITEDYLTEVLEFFERIGIVPKIKNGYYYPSSNQATSIRNALFLEAKRKNVKIKNNFLVTRVTKSDCSFVIKSKDEQLEFDKVIIATGSCASPKTGSDGSGYEFAKDFGHTIIKPLPALVQLRVLENENNKYLKDWAGVRTDATVTISENGNMIKEEIGEIQLTDYGISGICVFNISRFVSRGLLEGKKEIVHINFLPFLNLKSTKDYLIWFDEQDKKVKSRTIKELLEGVLNDKLVHVILKISNIEKNNYWHLLSSDKKQKLITVLTSFEVEISSTNSYDSAQVCSGGISLNEVNLQKMESLIVPGIYFAGEILDVDGDCGGYNLTFAWLSGMLAGKGAIGGDKND